MRLLTRFLRWLSCLLPTLGLRMRRAFYGLDSPGRDWRYDPECHRWIYRPSEGPGEKGYVCSEFVRAMIECPATGDPQGKEPQWGRGSQELESQLIKTWLTAQQYQTNGCRCGCCAGEKRDCVVVYVFDDGAVDHVAIFDPERCDWVAKRSGTQREKFIERMVDSMDYVRCHLQPDALVSTPTFYCKAGQAPARRSVGDLHRLGRNIP